MPSDDLNSISIHRFVFVMKAITENNLWDEVLFHFEEKGHDQIQVSSEQIALLKEVLSEKVSEGEPLNKRGLRFLRSATCGTVRPPPATPHGGGDAGSDSGHAQ